VQSIVDAYTELHEQGAAHSVETWIDGQLVGGLCAWRLAERCLASPCSPCKPMHPRSHSRHWLLCAGLIRCADRLPAGHRICLSWALEKSQERSSPGPFKPRPSCPICSGNSAPYTGSTC
jgi:hypothetical protein